MALSHPVDVVSEALGVSRATLHRVPAEHVEAPAAPSDIGSLPENDDAVSATPGTSHRALSEEERQSVRDLLNGERFVDQAPAAIFTTLLDEGEYVCSVSTMYRILRAAGQCNERRQRPRSQYHRPELMATGPNQLWSWDITKLKGPAKWTYYYLYVIMDVFSRYIVGWTISTRESASLAEILIDQTCKNQGIQPGQLTIHADRGSAMTSKPVAFLLADLGVTKTHSRPHVSNDNPYSEAQFKTLKYRPDFPECFGSIQDARSFSQAFFSWYNQEHRHSGIAMMTPENVHYGRTDQVLTVRQQTLTRAYARNPERFVSKPPTTQQVPEAAWINPPASQSTG
jgi:putative transposase